MTWPSGIRSGLAFGAFLFAGSAALGAPPVRQSFNMEVPVSPTPVAVNAASRLVYELHLTSFAREPLRLQAVSILDPQRAGALAELRGDALARQVAQPAAASADVDTLTVSAGARAIVYLELDLARGEATPAELKHRVEFARGATAETVIGARVPVRRQRPLTLGAPLRAGPWAAVYHPSWTRGHRRFVYAVEGRARIPGRFAIDWIRLDAEGRQAPGDPDVVADWIGYGAEVLAVADAVVVAARDDVAESARLSTHPDHPLEDATGNYVALDLGQDRYAFYEHLKPGSVRVKPRERVRRGQVIAALGFTGHSTGPHLHFHLADTSSPLGGEGMPFVLERFESLGGYEDAALLGKARWTPTPAAAATRSLEMPAPNSVVQFGAESASQREDRPVVKYLPELLDIFFAPGQPRSRRIFMRDAAGRVGRQTLSATAPGPGSSTRRAAFRNRSR